jgi:membrane associated rhomboid family serine protease
VLPRPIAVGLTVLISFMWAVNLVVGFLYPGRSDPYVNAIFGVVVAAVYTLGRRDTVAVRRARARVAQLVEGDQQPEEAASQEEGA